MSESSDDKPTAGPERYFEITIDNLPEITACYGIELARLVRSSVRERARAWCSRHGRLIGDRDDGFLILVHGTGRDPARDAGLAEALLRVLGQTPVSSPDGLVLPVLSLTIVAPEDDLAGVVRLSSSPSPRPGDFSPSVQQQRIRYMEDMASAASVSRAMEEGRLRLVLQPIIGGFALGQVLYHECLLRMTDPSGMTLMPGRFLPALERLGLVRGLDQWVLGQAIDILQANPGFRLGCNISAQSATVDGWWSNTLARLEASPDLACRLTVEITETAPLPDAATAQAFFDAMRALGCRVAIDDFGAAAHSLAVTAGLRPDIIKIDAVFVRTAKTDARDARFLAHLVGLGASIADHVVIEGIESDQDLQGAMSAGTVWVQGFHVGVPCEAGFATMMH